MSCAEPAQPYAGYMRKISYINDEERNAIPHPIQQIVGRESASASRLLEPLTAGCAGAFPPY